MQIKLQQCPMTGAVQLKLDKPFDRTTLPHIKFRKMIKEHTFEWDYDVRCWEGSIDAMEDMLEDPKHLAVIRFFIQSNEPQGLSFIHADGSEMEQDDWIKWVKTFNMDAVAGDLKSIPKAKFNSNEAGSSQEATPVKRKFEGPPHAGKKSAA